uniref:(California timema) hypothetical protein n=1 Tax=Timema californicum TaxID=61474 RepID=A0A7R9J9V9_TIMCA|nr:unnamed protein product [Timema californicum]
MASLVLTDSSQLTSGSQHLATPQIAAATIGDCTFEIDECGWSNAAARERVDDIDWDRTSGFFMTLARSNVQRPGSRAWFASHKLKASSLPLCVSFWFVLNEPFIDNTGPSLGSLSVYVKMLDKNGNIQMAPIWRLYNHQGPEWRYAQAVIQEINNDHVFGNYRTFTETPDVHDIREQDAILRLPVPYRTTIVRMNALLTIRPRLHLERWGKCHCLGSVVRSRFPSKLSHVSHGEDHFFQFLFQVVGCP